MATYTRRAGGPRIVARQVTATNAKEISWWLLTQGYASPVASPTSNVGDWIVSGGELPTVIPDAEFRELVEPLRED